MRRPIQSLGSHAIESRGSENRYMHTCKVRTLFFSSPTFSLIHTHTRTSWTIQCQTVPTQLTRHTAPSTTKRRVRVGQNIHIHTWHIDTSHCFSQTPLDVARPHDAGSGLRPDERTCSDGAGPSEDDLLLFLIQGNK